MFDQVSPFVFAIVGVVIGFAIRVALGKMGIIKSEQKADLIMKEANLKAENLIKQGTLDGKSAAHEMKLAAEKEIKERKAEVVESENKLLRREDALNYRDKALTDKENQHEAKARQLNEKAEKLKQMEEELQAKIDIQINELERISSLSQAEAKEELFAAVEKRMANEVAAYIKDQEENAKEKANDISRNIIGQAIQRYAQEEVQERTVSVVALPSEEMKGRIIGREGRNIKAIEMATGVDLIIDDTPECITISCFDPIRREIARQSLETLIRDGRIQPGRIEEVVAKVTAELNETIRKAGEDAIFQLNLGKIDRELTALIGRLKYRYSYGQNVLQHSLEVAHLAGMMAAELGLNQSLAKRAGLLHDIGKAVDFEVEGSHVELGAKIAKKYGENSIVLNAIESHHGDKPVTSVISNLVAAADTLSAARPGARFEALESYIERLEQLEAIAKSFDGVESSYAIQAGREIRVMAIPDKLDDVGCYRVAREIKERIENELTYPGQIKVTVIRELRANELAK